ncbi:glycosyltransferase family 4 protein [Parabacteroides sp.]
MITILILYTELMPYNVIVIKELVKKGCRVHVVLQDTNKKTPYLPPLFDGVTYYNRSEFRTSDHLFRFVKKVNPDLVWTAGWIDPLYNELAGMIRKKMNLPVIASSDTQWRGGRQWFNVLTSRFRHQQWFSYLFVSGEWQVRYARKLGFRPDQILMHNLSADVNLFSRIDINSRAANYPKRLLYVGRFSPEKGLVYLLKAWESISNRKGWQLTLVGNGPEKEKLTGYPDVEILDFMDQQELLQVMENSGAFILPSVSEPWALVIHEAACAGLPVLASDCCGAVVSFLREGENGYLFTPGDIRSIRHSIEKLLIQPETELLKMGRNSRKLGMQITPEKVAETLLTVLE